MNVFIYIVFSYIIILFLVLFSYKERLSQEKEIIFTSLRCAIQLIALGYLLKYIFSLKEKYWLILILIIITFIASVISAERLKIKHVKKSFLIKISFLSLFISSVIIFTPCLLIGLIKFTYRETIPLWGLVVGQGINSLNLAQERLFAESLSKREEIEAKIALGATLKQALEDIIKSAITTSLIPKYNNLKTIGIVTIPGITAGMLIAGKDPLIAIFYQILVLYLILGISLFSSYFIIKFSYPFVFFNYSTSE